MEELVKYVIEKCKKTQVEDVSNKINITNHRKYTMKAEKDEMRVFIAKRNKKNEEMFKLYMMFGGATKETNYLILHRDNYLMIDKLEGNEKTVLKYLNKKDDNCEVCKKEALMGSHCSECSCRVCDECLMKIVEKENMNCYKCKKRFRKEEKEGVTEKVK